MEARNQVLDKYYVDGFEKGTNGNPDVIYEFAGLFLSWSSMQIQTRK